MKRISKSIIFLVLCLSALLYTTITSSGSADQWTNPVLIGQYVAPDNFRDVYVDEDVAYLADDTNGVYIIDVSDPTEPTYLGKIDVSIARKIVVEDKLAYLTTPNGFSIYNISNPSSPVLLDNYDISESAWGLFYREGLAYVGFRYYGFQVLNVTDSSNITFLGEYVEGSNQNYNDVFVEGEFAYIADYQGGNVKVIDISNSSEPILQDRCTDFDTVQGGPKTIVVKNNIAYVANYDGGLVIANVSDPSNVQILNTYEFNRTSDVVIIDDIAVVSSYDYGINVLNISDIMNPVKLGEYNEGDAPYNIFYYEGLIYAGYGTDGLKILDTGYDDDKDLLSDGAEYFLYNTDLFNNDSDSDGLLDGEEVYIYFTLPLNNDSDSDTINDGDEIKIYYTNPNLKDSDSDGLDDNLEIFTHGTDPTNEDSDFDGLTDGEEIVTYDINPLSNDTDSDGLLDKWEVTTGTNPKLDDASSDLDSDGLTNLEEHTLGTFGNLADSDDDGLNDSAEVTIYLTDPMNEDSDGDSYTDGQEVNAGSDPNDKNSIPVITVTESPTVTASFNWVFICISFLILIPIVRKRKVS